MDTVKDVRVTGIAWEGEVAFALFLDDGVPFRAPFLEVGEARMIERESIELGKVEYHTKVRTDEVRPVR